jgi:hypothetical protein
MTPVDKNGIPLEVGQKVRITVRNTVYPGVLLGILAEKTIPSKDACIVVVEIDGEPECVGSYRLEVVE